MLVWVRFSVGLAVVVSEFFVVDVFFLCLLVCVIVGLGRAGVFCAIAFCLGLFT